MNRFKALLHEIYTKRDVNGNVYHVVKITHPGTGGSFITETPSMGNVEHILYEIFPHWYTGGYPFYRTESCTDSSRLSSLPSAQHLNACHGDEAWKKALRSIGYKIPKQVK